MEQRIAYPNFIATISLLALQSLAGWPSAQASEIEKWLIMPGPVIASHAEFEADCGACHAPLSGQSQSDLCIACHKEVGEDVMTKSGFHGRLPTTERLLCEGCHTEHDGRDVDVIALDATTFDHTLTDFALLGAHTGVACDSCHAGEDAHRDAPTDCVACHRADDVHSGRLGDDCGGCHEETAWNAAVFDHSSTGFQLTGAHADVGCSSCHHSDDFSSVGQTCNDCHSKDDVHKGKNGGQCSDCHNAISWTKVIFNHMTVSGFALVGGHKGLSCQDCHRAEDFTDLGGSTCNDCHRRVDPHEGRFGTDCGSCHNNFDWDSIVFNHEAETGFALPKGHRSLACDACHTQSLTVALPTDCANCHVADDVHEGQLGDRCTGCHVPTSWTAKLWFDHDITSFPLIGAHADVSCEQCHATAAFHDADSACISCHVDDDPHQGGLGEQCDNCHNPANWRAWQFDHDHQTDFSLTGAHTGLACDACHSETVGGSAAIPDDCNSCHRRDDPHFGRFGNNCETCHTTSSFSQIEGM